MSVRVSLAVSACLILAACSSATSGTGQPNTPSPEPGNPAPGLPTPVGASAITYVPVRDAAYALVRHDSLNLQLPGGANQLQLNDRTAYLHLTLARDTNGFLATIVLDSLQVAVGGVPASPDSVIPARGTRWTAALSPNGQLSGLKADRSS